MKLSQERPTLRIGCGSWLKDKLIDAGISGNIIDVYEWDVVYQYKNFSLYIFPLFHGNTPNCGYKLEINNQSMCYIVDTNDIKEPLPDLDLYMIEVNHSEAEIQERIDKKLMDGDEYIYEYQAANNHLSKETAEKYLAENAGQHSLYVELHGHKENKDV